MPESSIHPQKHDTLVVTLCQVTWSCVGLWTCLRSQSHAQDAHCWQGLVVSTFAMHGGSGGLQCCNGLMWDPTGSLQCHSMSHVSPWPCRSCSPCHVPQGHAWPHQVTQSIQVMHIHFRSHHDPVGSHMSHATLQALNHHAWQMWTQPKALHNSGHPGHDFWGSQACPKAPHNSR